MGKKSSAPTAQDAYNPLQYESSFGSSFWGGITMKMRYSPWFGAKVYAAMWFICAVIALIYFSASGSLRNTQSVLVVGAFLLLAVLTLVIYPMYKRYDIGSSVNYCRRLLGPNATEKELKACMENRENLEGISGGNGGLLTGLLLGSALRD